MAYTTLVAGTTITAAWANASVRDQTIAPFASAAARASAITAPVEGMVSHLNDVNCLTVYSGAAWSTVGPVHGAMTGWTPTVSQPGGVTVTTNAAKYSRTGRLITGYFNLAVTGTGTASNAIGISIPFTAVGAGQPVGVAEVFDTSASARYEGNLLTNGTNDFCIRSASSTVLDNRLGLVVFTAALAVGDTITGVFSYEAAADA